MKKCMFIKRKMNNTGMTLVEILIAMSIVSIAVVPLMYCFVRVSQTSMRGRSLQQTSVVAQTVMENCKTYNVENIIEQVEDGSFLNGVYSGYYEHAYTTGTTDFYINNVRLDNSVYGINFTLTPIASSKQTMMKYDNMNSKLDGIFIEESTVESDTDKTMKELEAEMFMGLMDDVASQLGGIVTGDDVYRDFYRDSSPTNNNYQEAKVEREITIQAKRSAGVDVVEVTYEYTLLGGEYIYQPMGMPAVPYPYASVTKSAKKTIYSNANSNNVDHPTKLENVYFFYYPAYNSPLYDEYPCDSDTIVIKNDLNEFEADGSKRVPLNVFLVKQETAGIDLENAEKGAYDVKINHSGHKVIMHHNFGTNLGNGSDASDQVGWDGYSGDILFSQDDERFENIDSIVVEEEKDLMYDIDVVVYENPQFSVVVNPVDASTTCSMTGNQVLVLEGTKFDW